MQLRRGRQEFSFWAIAQGVPQCVQGQNPCRHSRGRSPLKAEAVYRQCLQNLTTEAIKI